MSEYHTFVDFVLNTKLMEYGIAFLFIGLFALFYRLVQAPAGAAATESVASRALSRIRGLLVPEDVSYHQGHTWARLEGAGLAAVGMDDFAGKLVGAIDQVRLPAVGSQLRQGEKGWTVLSGGKAVDMVSPVDGTVVAVNEAAAGRPGEIGQDPYGRGWLLKVESPKIGRSIRNLLTGLLARQWTEQSVESLFARVSPEMGRVAADGGQPMAGMARQLEGENWDRLARELFLTE